METFLLVLHVILSFAVVVVILLQSGKGGGLGAGFNNAAALGQEVFGGRGAAGFLVKLTVVLGTAFMITSMALAWYSSKPQSALDLQMEADEPARAVVHDIIEEGQGAGGGADQMPEGLQMEMPDGDDGSSLEVEVDGADGEIPEEIREQLEGLELDQEVPDGPVEEEIPVDPEVEETEEGEEAEEVEAVEEAEEVEAVEEAEEVEAVEEAEEAEAVEEAEEAEAVEEAEEAEAVEEAEEVEEEATEAESPEEEAEAVDDEEE